MKNRTMLGYGILGLFLTFTVLAVGGCGTVSSRPPRVVSLDIPEAFRNELAIHHFAKGQKVVDRGFMEMTALAPMTRYEGYWGPRSDYELLGHSSWWLDIYAGGSRRVADAYLRAKDGYEANLDEWFDFFSPIEQTGPMQPLWYLCARFERKHFPWGDAVSFLTHAIQDTGIFMPSNRRFLTYEVWGVTKDGRYTVVMHTAVKNPLLGAGRVVSTMEALKKDPGYRFIESCNADDFVPSLSAVDNFLDSLRLQ